MSEAKKSKELLKDILTRSPDSLDKKQVEAIKEIIEVDDGSTEDGKLNPLFLAVQVIALSATAIGGMALLVRVIDQDGPSFTVVGRDQFVELRTEFEQDIAKIGERLSLLDATISAAQDLDVTQAEMSVAIQENTERLSAVERTLDTQPREILELVRLRDSMEGLEEGFRLREAQVLREVDRAYNTVLALIASLFVAVAAMVIGNFLSRKDDR